jgi:hypothetical protein
MRKLVFIVKNILFRLLTFVATGCIDDESRHHALALRAVRLTLFAGVLRTRANQPLPSVSGPRQFWRTTMSKAKGELVSVKIIPNEQGSPAGKLADAEVVFEAEAGPLSGMKLIGFAVWERRDGGRNVTFPARQYSVNGERRTFALLRPANGEQSAQEAIRQCILDAYTRVQAHA